MTKVFGRGMRRAASVVAAGALAAAFAAAPAAANERAGAKIPGSYIVVFKDSVSNAGSATSARERALGFRARHRYGSAVKGFSAKLSDAQVRRLRADASVSFVAADRVVQASDTLAPGETVPVGMRRIDAATTTAVHSAATVGVAVIDTGIDPNHTDLNVARTSTGAVDGRNCIDSSKSPADDHGHGTHVAGTVAAANNGSGVVGVAPGTKVFAVKVLNARGSGSTSNIVCGIDWVTANAAAKNIGVANMSLGGGGPRLSTCAATTDPEHKAICNSTAAGVLYAVAAGNSGWDFDYESQPDTPAVYPEVVTVSAMADTDGQPGGLGVTCSREKDDRYASFSNYALTALGRTHTVSAPGVCIASTKMGGGTTSMSGTSMASPHIAGALALCRTSGLCGAGDSPATLIEKITPNSTSSYGVVGQPWSGSKFLGLLTRVPAPTGGDTTTPPGDDTGTDPGDGDGTDPGDGGTITDPFALTATGYKVKGVQHVDLTWNAAAAGTSSVVVERSGASFTTPNDGAHTDVLKKGGGSYTYRVCAAGSTTNCSAEKTVVF